MLRFYLGSGNLNSGPYPHVAGILLAEPSRQPQGSSFYSRAAGFLRLKQAESIGKFMNLDQEILQPNFYYPPSKVKNFFQ